jgi:GNAT superfamily N-acetyltransferase
MHLEPLTDQHISEAVALAQAAYAHERRHIPALTVDDVSDALTAAISALVQQGQGVAAVVDGHLTGYLAFHGPIGGFFGSGTGCFAPLHGYAATGPDPVRLSSLLFQRAAEMMTARGVDTFAVTNYAHDRAAATAFSLNGFGIRNADAIRDLDHADPIACRPSPGIAYTEIAWTDTADLLPLKNGLVHHLHRSPTFVAASVFSAEQFAALCAKHQSRFFVARDGDAPIAYMEVIGEGENILTVAPDMRNICGAFLIEEYRGRGIYQSLLQFALGTLRSEGIRRVGVDFETMNPTALRFWTKYFDVYTHSYARRIDALG